MRHGSLGLLRDGSRLNDCVLRFPDNILRFLFPPIQATRQSMRVVTADASPRISPTADKPLRM